MAPNNRLTLAAGLLGAALLWTPVRAAATIVQNVSFDDKVSNAESIVLGHCTETKSMWDPEHRWILTYAKFTVEESLKGTPVREITVVTPGGSFGGVHQSSVGITPFEKGDERVLFVRNTRVGPTVLYFDQGTYNISKDEHGERVITPIAISESARMDTQRGLATAAEQPRTLREFVGDVKTAERRIEAVKMEMMERQRQHQAQLQQQTPIGSLARRYWYLIALAGLGAALATWQILRK
ncbi:MAG: hypothetical protein ACXVIJ_04310 [Thermoanaerobaculia bacterium]